ncbi:MAG TPA: hypothetical protein VMT10_00830 [Solirubrobacteraceae bacterium]|nr:hypothetical protein [Solirubrobacteraceae bacterium]
MTDFSGIADADARLGRPFPLPSAPLPLGRWVDVSACGDGAEVVWNLDDTRPGAPARLALYAGPAPPPARALPGAVGDEQVEVAGVRGRLRSAPLEEAEASLRPVRELVWEAGGLHLRLTAQGPWRVDELREIAESIRA